MGRLKTVPDAIGMAELKKGSFFKAVGAEFLGTMLLVLIGCGSCLGDTNTVRIAFTFGLTVATLAQALGHVSGCHVNPAVTVGFLVARYISVVRAIIYIVAQVVGAIAGAAILYGLVPEQLRGSLGNTSMAEGVTLEQAFGIELIISFFLVLVVFGATDDRRADVKGSVPLAIGFSITAAHLFAVPLTGSSMNPARSFGPAVVTGVWENHWVYWVGPAVGGMLAGLIYSYIFRAPKTVTSASDIEIGKHERY